MEENQIKLSINGIALTGKSGQTILDIARENGIDIPALCDDKRAEMYGSCGMCTVEVEGVPKLLRSCSTLAADGMKVLTETQRVRSNRKAALELLLSDHTGDCRPPCVLACPAQTDCQGYVGLIADGKYADAVELVREKIPFPASIGRVCPHPCEEACRRKLVEEPVSIAALKTFLGDTALRAQGGMPDVPGAVRKENSKKVAVAGGGPGGLTAAYFLRKYGYTVTVYDAMPKMGGMLMYGIPEYRLPKDILSSEIEMIEKSGVEFRCGVKIGRDITLQQLRDDNDAVIVAVGAWAGMGLRCPGDKLPGVLGGIDFLRDAALGNTVNLGKAVAVVGGGNTAMDACRTAVRLGVEKVYNIYRRTKDEMPAESVEIEQAQQEGVIFKYLRNPVEILSSANPEDMRVRAIRLQVMELGEPDDSGRRSPVPVKDAEEFIAVDTVIAAIGQRGAFAGFEELQLTEKGTIAADEHTLRTSLDGVFAVGDATNKGADIAVSAIGEGKRAAETVDKYLKGEELTYTKPFLSKSEKTADDFAGREKSPRINVPCRKPEERAKDFHEILPVFTQQQAQKEASRCLECGCMDYFECKLLEYANRYSVNPQVYSGVDGGKKARGVPEHRFIVRDPGKCILCGLCARVCSETVGASALGLVGRGFDCEVQPALGMPLQDTDCISCGNCAAVCPTGALTEKTALSKQIPLNERHTDTVCAFCGVGCKTKLTSYGNSLVRSLPDGEDALLCVKGRFGFGEITKKQRPDTAFKRERGELVRTDFAGAVSYANEKIRKIKEEFGSESIAVTVSDRYTNEEVSVIKAYADALGARVFSFAVSGGGLADVNGTDCSTVTFSQLADADLIVAVAPKNLYNKHPVAAMKIRKAVQKGAELLLISDEDSFLDESARIGIKTRDLSVLREIAKAMTDMGTASELRGYDDLRTDLHGTEVSETAKNAAQKILAARNPVFVFERNGVTTDGSRLIADIAAVAGNGKRPLKILQLLSGANTAGLIGMGVRPGDDLKTLLKEGEIHALLIFGEEITGINLASVDFLLVQDICMTGIAERAHVFLPASFFAETSGTYTGADGEIRKLNPAVKCELEMDNTAQIKALADAAGITLNPKKMNPAQPFASPQLIPTGGSRLRRVGYPNTNTLYNSFMERFKSR